MSDNFSLAAEATQRSTQTNDRICRCPDLRGGHLACGGTDSLVESRHREGSNGRREMHAR
jgi:hypothetical protein